MALAGCHGATRPLTAPPDAVQVTGSVTSRAATDPVLHDADDPSIWISREDPTLGLIIGSDKVETKGGLYVFGLDGRLRQAVTPLDRPNNVDVEYGIGLAGRQHDICVVTERLQRRLRVFAIRSDGSGIDDISSGGGIPVLAGQAGEAGEPMGIALYKRPRDGAVFAIVSPKSGGATEYLWQYRLMDDGQGRVTGEFVRRFGHFSQRAAAPGEAGEIEAIVVDDELGFVYYADERFGIRKWHADPDHPHAGRELAAFGTEGYSGDREGLAIYREAGGRGYLLSSDQVPGRTRLHLYPREGAAGAPHNHPRLALIQTDADETDGLEVVEAPVGSFTLGILVMMNSGPKNFLVFDWRDIAAAGSLPRQE